MSSTATLHFVCDTCGKKADVEQVYPNQTAYPEGWAPSGYNSMAWGDYCSEACYRQVEVDAAIKRAAERFAPNAEVLP